MAICIGDLMIFAFFASLADHPREGLAVLIVHDAITHTPTGQIDDLTHQIPTLATHCAVVANKTGLLQALHVRLALCAAVASVDEISVLIGDQIVSAYQALDDLVDRDNDQAAGCLNICLILETTGTSPSEVRHIIAYETHQALTAVRALSAGLPSDCGTAFQQIADRLAITFTEYADAA